MLTSNQLFALLWAVTCVLYQYNVLRAASLKRRRTAEDFEDARTVVAAEDAVNQLLDEREEAAAEIFRDYNIRSPWQVSRWFAALWHC